MPADLAEIISCGVDGIAPDILIVQIITSLLFIDGDFLLSSSIHSQIESDLLTASPTMI
jgi:hypothetical protein